MPQGTPEFVESLFGLTGATALITGATSGIGLAIAESFVKAGASVYVHGRDFTEAEAVALRLGAQPVAGDLSDPAAIDRLCDDLLARGTGLDVLVNNAGVEIPAALQELTDKVLTETFAVNTAAPVHLSRRLLPLLTGSLNGSIINVSSIHDRVPSHSNAAYAASKAALRMITETLAIELGPVGVRVNNVSPGAIATDINREIIAKIGPEHFAELIPLGRVGAPTDVAGAAIFLASAAARYISGATLVVDGAYSHHLVRYRGLDDH